VEIEGHKSVELFKMISKQIKEYQYCMSLKNVADNYVKDHENAAERKILRDQILG